MTTVKQNNAKRWRIGLLGLIVSAAAILLIATQIDIEILRTSLQTARWEYAILCMVVLSFGLFTRAMRWRLLLSGGLPYMRTFHIMNIAYMANNLLPFRIGEVVRAYLATRAEPPVPVFKSFSTIVVERLLDLLSIVMLLAFAVISGPVPEELRYAGAIFGSLGFGGFLFLILLSRKREFTHSILRFFVARLPFLQRLNPENWLDHFLDGLLPLAKLDTLIGALFWTAVSWGFSIAGGYILMYTFYEEASFAATCLYIAAIGFAIAVPAVPGSLGTYELSIILALGAVGYGEPASTAAAFAVTVHAANLIVHAITGIFGFVAEGISLEQLQQGVRTVTVSDATDSKEMGEHI